MHGIDISASDPPYYIMAYQPLRPNLATLGVGLPH
jgi:hypothetical protein